MPAGWNAVCWDWSQGTSQCASGDLLRWKDATAGAPSAWGRAGAQTPVSATVQAQVLSCRAVATHRELLTTHRQATVLRVSVLRLPSFPSPPQPSWPYPLSALFFALAFNSKSPSWTLPAVGCVVGPELLRTLVAGRGLATAGLLLKECVCKNKSCFKNHPHAWSLLGSL